MSPVDLPPPTDPPALGSNPFDRVFDDADDPFLTALAAIETRRRVLGDWVTNTDSSAVEDVPEAAEAVAQETIEPVPDLPPRKSNRPRPRLDEVRPPPARDLVDQWMGEDLRHRLAALSSLVDRNVGYDRHGLSLEALRRAAPVFRLLYEKYFRVESEGHEHVPVSGPVVLASNHAGLLPFDGAMIVMDLVRSMDPPRLARAVVDRFVGDLPWVNVFMARVGQFVGTRAAIRDLLADEQAVLVFPEGTKGILKPVTQRYRVQEFTPGFVREALRSGAPVVPMAVIGSDDQSPILADFAPLAKLLGLPGFPITPTFPLLGPVGLLPYPVRYKIVYGEPVDLDDAHRGSGADDPRRLARLADRVRRRVQGLVNRHQAGGHARR